MDTRSKIIRSEEAGEMLKNKPVRRVSGHFDPLLAEHVRRLRACAGPGYALVVEITNAERPLMPQCARAELVAALGMVDYVVVSDNASAQPADDADVTGRFVDHVLRRHQQEQG